MATKLKQKRKMKQLTKEEQKKLNEIFKENQVVFAYLFGSAAQGKTGPLSDIDMAILFSEKIRKEDYFNKELRLATEIGKLFKIDRVDIINLETTRSPLLKQRAVLKGKPIFVADKKKKFALERKILQEYENTKHLRKVQNEIMRRQIKEGTFGKPVIRKHLIFFVNLLNII
jgi:predicted nucleotidyltransferase